MKELQMNMTADDLVAFYVLQIAALEDEWMGVYGHYPDAFDESFWANQAVQKTAALLELFDGIRAIRSGGI